MLKVMLKGVTWEIERGQPGSLKGAEVPGVKSGDGWDQQVGRARSNQPGE